jgi:DtxR family Mn-dependent transcriptional regulator
VTVIWIVLGVGLLATSAIAVRQVRDHEARERARIEDALKHLFDLEYRGRHGSFSSLGGALHLGDRTLMRVLARLQEQGLVLSQGQEFHLTSEGERVARQVVRAHRLLERYFADEARLPLREIHDAAERREHTLTPGQVDALAASLGHPRLDPHGDPIPDRDGRIQPPDDTPLTAWPVGRMAQITHLEDEPPLAYAQILAEGLRIGQAVRIVESTAERLVLSDGENEFRLAPAVAANVFVTPRKDVTIPGAVPLADLPSGQVAEVIELDRACQGFSRRRLMDLGFTAGARLEAALENFAGDPRAYRIRGTLVALRQDQARQVMVRPLTAAIDSAQSQEATL